MYKIKEINNQISILKQELIKLNELKKDEINKIRRLKTFEDDEHKKRLKVFKEIVRF